MKSAIIHQRCQQGWSSHPPPRTDGWARARGNADKEAVLRTECYGPVVVDAVAPPYLGAAKVTNNTAELTALAEGLEYLRDVDGATGPAIVRPDSEYAMDLALGRSKPTENVALATRVRRLWQAEGARRGGSAAVSCGP